MIKRLAQIVFASMMLTALSGCVAVVVGAAAVGTYVYVRGEFQATEGVSLDKAWSATLAAMNDLQFVIVKQGKDQLAGELTAKNNATNKSVHIYVKKLSDTATEIDIRVGRVGDEAASRAILEKIKSHF